MIKKVFNNIIGFALMPFVFVVVFISFQRNKQQIMDAYIEQYGLEDPMKKK